MTPPDPLMTHQHAIYVEEALGYFGAILASIFGTHGFHRIRQKRENGKNGKASLSDVVNAANNIVHAIHMTSDQTREAILEDGERTRESLDRTRAVIVADGKETREAIRTGYASQATLCGANRDIAIEALAVLKGKG